jgi:hypothetical protein
LDAVAQQQGIGDAKHGERQAGRVQQRRGQ